MLCSLSSSGFAWASRRVTWVVCVVAGGVGVVRLLQELEPFALLELLDSVLPVVFEEGTRPRLAVEEQRGNGSHSFHAL